MNKLETAVYTNKEVRDKNFHVEKSDEPFIAIAFAKGQVVLYKWFSDKNSATIWSLEKSFYEYS